MNNFINKHFVVLGGSSGIGKKCVNELANLGASITIVGRSEGHVNQTFEEINANCLPTQMHNKIVTDLSDLFSIKNLVSEIGILDGIVFSAGEIIIKPLQFIEIEEFLKLQNINSISILFFIKECLIQKKIKNNSSILLVGSISGTKVGYKGSIAYSYSKGALSGMAKSLALELARFKIRVNSILPAMVAGTRLGVNFAFSEEQINSDKDKYPLSGNYLSVDDIVGSVIFFMSDMSKMITGSELVIDSGFTLN